MKCPTVSTTPARIIFPRRNKDTAKPQYEDQNTSTLQCHKASQKAMQIRGQGEYVDLLCRSLFVHEEMDTKQTRNMNEKIATSTLK